MTYTRLPFTETGNRHARPKETGTIYTKRIEFKGTGGPRARRGET